MPDNATLGQKVQIGIESTWGTAVPATKIPKSFSLDLDVQTNNDAFTPMGNIFPTSNAQTQEWTEGSLDGVLTYTEVVYALSALFGPATITTAAGGTTSKQWKWSLTGTSLLTPKALTVEKGSSIYAFQAAGAVLTGLDLSYSRTDRIAMTGDLIAKAVTPGVTMTTIAANPTVPQVRVLPQQIQIKNAATFAGLGAASAYTRAFEMGLSIGGMYGGVWPLNSAVTGMDGIVQLVPDVSSTLLLMADATATSMLTTLRSGGTTYLRTQATGAIIEATVPYSITIDQTVQVQDIDGFSDHDGLYAVPFTFQPIDNGTDPVLEITVVNALTAL